MGNIGEISINDIETKYNLGFQYAENIVNRLEEIGYIKKKEECGYKIIRTEQEIDDYIKSHMEELRPIEYKEHGWKDNGKPTFKSKLEMYVSYYKTAIPGFLRRILFSIPGFVLFLGAMFVSAAFGQVQGKNISILQYIIFYIYLSIYIYVCIIIPFNLMFRIVQARIYGMKFSKFMLLPKNWFFKRCKDTIEIYAILYPNKKFFISSYDEAIKKLVPVLNEKKSLADHYMDMANDAENEDELYQSINSCISTLEWMAQFEKFGVFTDGPLPSDCIKTIKEGM